jgi:dienelactone hydrolase
MDIARTYLNGPGYDLPCVAITPPSPLGGAVISHGYGGCKEELLGLAWRVAERGLATYTIDLRGHGQHPLPMDDRIIDDIEVAVRHCRRYGKVVAIGHSLGGRLSLMSSADHAIGISPPTDSHYCSKTQEQLQKVRGYRVRPNDSNAVFDLLKKLPECKEDRSERTLVIYGSRDVPEIVEACDKLRASTATALRIEQARHGDTPYLEGVYEAIADQLAVWFGLPDGPHPNP